MASQRPSFAAANSSMRAKIHATMGPERIVIATISALLLCDSLLTAFIVYRVPYTKIDWDAYMSQVDGFLGGERNYSNLRGDTGPLVYPAGFLYAYSGIQYVTGGLVSNAQVVFGLLYILDLVIVIAIYRRAIVLPWWAFCLLCLSKRVHSIFVLRLFNDCIATTLTHLSILLFQSSRWKSGMVVFSFAVSIKMNVLLYAPPLLLLMFKVLTLVDIFATLLMAAIVQVLLGMPFLWFYPWDYISKSFDLGRVFIHFWSVNFKFVPEALFISKGFALVLLVLHMTLLLLFAHCKWCNHEKGLLSALNLTCKLQQVADFLKSPSKKVFGKEDQVILKPRYVTTVLFTGNFIGVLCARSLHYQFYSWYFYSLPYLLWRTPFPTFLRLIVLGVIEACWNVYPSNSISSLVLLACHLVLLIGLWYGPCEYPYSRSAAEKFE